MNIAVCDDDENFYNNNLKEKLLTCFKNTKTPFNIDYFNNGLDLLKKFEDDYFYDIVILDIDMPVINGKKLASKLRLLNSSFFLIFVSSYEKEVYNTIQYKISSFICKSDENKHIIDELKRVVYEFENQTPNFEIFTVKDKTNKTNYNVRLRKDELLYFECLNKNMYLSTIRSEFEICNLKLNDIIKKYCDDGFFETYRGIVVNIRKIKSIYNTEVLMDNNVKLPLSRGRKKLLLEKISDFLNEECALK